MGMRDKKKFRGDWNDKNVRAGAPTVFPRGSPLHCMALTQAPTAMTTKRLAWFALVALVGGNLFLGSASTVRAGGQFAVTDGGTAAYSYPIAVPPGIAGMAPKLSLSYSGNGINGPVGLGWSVQGLSVISRCPATIATDGAFRGVSFGPTDKLCLDGQRLIQTDANDAPLTTQTDDARGLATGSREYRTEKDTYARIPTPASAPTASPMAPTPTARPTSKCGRRAARSTNTAPARRPM